MGGHEISADATSGMAAATLRGRLPGPAGKRFWNWHTCAQQARRALAQDLTWAARRQLLLLCCCCCCCCCTAPVLHVLVFTCFIYTALRLCEGRLLMFLLALCAQRPDSADLRRNGPRSACERRSSELKIFLFFI